MPPRVCLIGGGVALWGAVCARREPYGVWAVRACGARERARRGRQRSGEGRGHRAERGRRERQHRRWYCTAEYCGRGGSRHFRRHRGFIPEGSLFVSLRATGDLLTRADCLLSVRQKKCLNGEKTASREHSEHLIGGKEKIVKKICIFRKKAVPLHAKRAI